MPLYFTIVLYVSLNCCDPGLYFNKSFLYGAPYFEFKNVVIVPAVIWCAPYETPPWSPLPLEIVPTPRFPDSNDDETIPNFLLLMLPWPNSVRSLPLSTEPELLSFCIKSGNICCHDSGNKFLNPANASPIDALANSIDLKASPNMLPPFNNQSVIPLPSVEVKLAKFDPVLLINDVVSSEFFTICWFVESICSLDFINLFSVSALTAFNLSIESLVIVFNSLVCSLFSLTESRYIKPPWIATAAAVPMPGINPANPDITSPAAPT